MTKRNKISSYFQKNGLADKDPTVNNNDKNSPLTQYSKYRLYDSPDLNHNTVLEIHPSLISNWKFHDRPEDELGDIEALADDIKAIGQQQPCIVRPLKNMGEQKYEIIAGERRWRASLLANISLKVIVKDIDDLTAALIQIAENENRKNLSDFAKAKSLQLLMQNSIVSQNDLVVKLKKSKQYISSLLSYTKIPTNVYDAIGNFSNVSASLAEKIKQLSFKGEIYQDAIIQLRNKIVKGTLGKTSLERAVNQIINKESTFLKKINTKDGNHVFSIQYTNKSILSIHFTKFARESLCKNLDTKNPDNKLIREIMQIIET